jgi:hypothetical protein
MRVLQAEEVESTVEAIEYAQVRAEALQSLCKVIGDLAQHVDGETGSHIYSLIHVVEDEVTSLQEELIVAIEVEKRQGNK